MVIFNKKWKKYNEIQLTKNIMDLNIRKMTNHPPSPGLCHRIFPLLCKYSGKSYNVSTINLNIEFSMNGLRMGG